MNKALVTLLVLGFMFVSAGVCLLANVPSHTLQSGFENIWNTLEVASRVSIVLFVLALLVGLCWLIWMAWNNGIIWHSEARIRKAQADGVELRGNLIITTVAPGSQVYASETGRLNLVHKPLYLSPGNVNGKEIVITQEQERRWAFFNLTQNISHKPDVSRLGEVTQVQVAWPIEVKLSELLPETGGTISNIILGVHINESGQRQIVASPLSKMVHVAIGGASGWGKSNFLRSLAYQLAIAPEAIQLAMIDLELVTFNPFKSSEKLRYPVADTEGDALAILGDLQGEMDKRKERYLAYPDVDSIGGYNRLSDEPLPIIALLMDEATALFDNGKVENAFKALVRRCRKYGIFAAVGGQSWKASDFDSSIRGQFSTVIHFKAKDASSSRVLLGRSDAAEITQQGQAYAVLPGYEMIQMQAPVVSPFAIPKALASPAMPVNEQTQKLEEFAKLVNEGMSRHDASLQVFGKKYSGEFAMDLKRHLSSLSFSSADDESAIFGENENESL